MASPAALATAAIARLTPRSRSLSPRKLTSSMRKTVRQKCTPLPVIFANQVRELSRVRNSSSQVKSNVAVSQITNCALPIKSLRPSSLVRPMMTPSVRKMSTNSDCEPPKEEKPKPKTLPKKKPNDKRSNCAPLDVMPKCSPENLEKSECMAEKKANEGKIKSPFKSFWYNPECCLDPCPDQFPRFDDLYWKPSDKAARKYERTWAECPDVVLPKKVCCTDRIRYPKIEKRKKKDRPKTACESLEPECPKGDGKCKKITMPHCRPVRASLKCKVYRGPSNCFKVCAPHPSFSECQKPRKKPRRPVECECLRLINMCEVFAMLRQKNMNKK